ncbi:MAG: TVP38/TMEM64 family protein [Thiotrichales bacterium]
MIRIIDHLRHRPRTALNPHDHKGLASKVPSGVSRRIGKWGIVAVASLVLVLALGLIDYLPELSAGTERLWREHRATVLEFVANRPVISALALFLSHALLAALGLPGASVLMLLAGAGFGTTTGTTICLAGCTLGSTATMLATRHFLRPYARKRLGDRLDRFDARIATDGAAYLFSLRLVPVIPFAVVNVAAGLTTLSAWTYTWVSFIGMAIGTFVYVNAGAQLGGVTRLADFSSPTLLASVLLLAALPWILKRLSDHWRDQREGSARADPQ